MKIDNLTPEQREAAILGIAIETYGADAQIIVAIEELSELTKSLTKYLRAGDTVSEETLESIHEEMADVSIMLNQLELIFGDYSDWECFKLDKLAAKLGMEGIGNMEHPVIKNLERTGGPDGVEFKAPVCPMCGEETDTLMKTTVGEIVGCDQCVKLVDAWDYTE